MRARTPTGRVIASIKRIRIQVPNLLLATYKYIYAGIGGQMKLR